MTFQELAANESARSELKKLLDHPIMAAVLTLLEQDNLPRVVPTLPDAPANMDPMHAIAISSAQRAGFQNCLYYLKNLPYFTGRPKAPPQSSAWEWTYQDPKISSEATSTKKQRKRN